MFLRQQYCSRQCPNRAFSVVQTPHRALSLTVISLLSLISSPWWLENILWASLESGQSRGWRGGAAEGGAGAGRELALAGIWGDAVGTGMWQGWSRAGERFLKFFSHPSDSLTPTHKPRDEHWELHAPISSIYYTKPQGCFNSPFHSASISKILARLPLPVLQWQLQDILPTPQVLLFFKSTFS